MVFVLMLGVLNENKERSGERARGDRVTRYRSLKDIKRKGRNMTGPGFWHQLDENKRNKKESKVNDCS